MQKILLTGGTGFIGNNVLKLLKLNPDYKILSLSRTKQYNSKELKWIRGDFGSLNKKTMKLILDFKPSILIHLGWQDIPNFSKKVCTDNLNKSKKFLNDMVKIQSIEKIIISGSCFEYLRKSGEVKEKAELDRKNFFPNSKIKLEEFTRKICLSYDKTFYWLRFFYVYGPNQRSGSLIPYIAKSIINNSELILNNPKMTLDFINVIDVSKIIKLFIKKKIPSGVYNVGSGKKTSVVEIYNYLFFKILKKKQNKYKIDKNNFFISNNKKLTKNIGKFKFTPIKNGLTNYLLWYRNIKK